MTKALVHGDAGRRFILLALAAIAILFAAALVTRPSSAQTAESPNWWRQMSDNMVCAPVAEKARLAECTIGPFQMIPSAKFPTSGKVQLYDETVHSSSGIAQSFLQPGSKPRSIAVMFRGMPDTGEWIFDRVARKSRLAGFGLESTKLASCPAGPQVVADVLKRLNVAYRGAIAIGSCRWEYSTYTGESSIQIVFTTEFGGSAPLSGNCNTDLLEGPWRAENAALAKTGHAVTFSVSTGGVGNHDGNQKRYRGEFTTYPAHKRLLGTAPTPMFTKDKAYPAGKGLCLIPVVISMRDISMSHDAALIDTKGGSVRFINERAYRLKDGIYQIYPDLFDAYAVSGAPGRWLRGAAPALPKTCSPADFNGRWDRSDGARVTIRGAGTQGVGGTGSMDENPGNWVRGQDKYASMRMKSACVYTAKCFASQRTTINGRPDFKMVETACELVIDPATKRMTERGTSNSYSYTKVGAGAAARKPPSAVTPPEPAQPSQAVQSLNSQQAAAAQREIQAYEARKKAIADEQAAKEAAYRKALADREALIAENNRRASEARAKWEAAVAACRAGDQSQCAPQPQR
ncbi:cell envelope integrity protein TolA [Sphingopyxis sp. RIFCSPHIGHO2_12_FULL_65_19]|uniref:cell envelope integrity protein TolA n=1 Tax=Sphingopyxis sp. RIFCSPHIGHO2_12_FULL_65_19 TaxID=1802172 RepID=UPI0025D3D0C2|nr:cell envelope integrity protein TolA [Sphingopyxis sp. RIFCSPHIGHO2_12_FULL_65_19]